jgi:D-arabinose 1-dehydrogenase-like Zn-dependent alcohol dehydrogenase
MAPTMEAIVLAEFGGDFRRETRPIPRPGSGEVLVEVVAVGAGLTLEHARLGRLGGTAPRVLGHELGGRIADVGPGVDGWAVGTRVTASFYLVCGRCRWCNAGRETLCAGFRGFVGAICDGAFAEYLVLPAANLVAVPDGVSLAEAGVVADAVATPYHAVSKRLGPIAGRTVVVIGAGGGVGVHALQVVRAFGGSVIAVERDPAKAAEIARRGLAETVVDPAAADWAQEALAAAGGEIDAVIDTVGSSETLAGAAASIGRAGTVVALGFQPGATLAIDPLRLISDEITITGTRYATRTEIAETLELVRTKRIEPVIGARFGLGELDDAFDAIRGNEVFGRVVIETGRADGGLT